MRKLSFLLLCILAMPFLYGQSVGIGTADPNKGAILELNSNSKAFLPPRMSFSQIKSIEAPVAGMMVYDNEFNCLRYYNGSKWITVDQDPAVASGSFKFMETGIGSSEVVIGAIVDSVSGNLYIAGNVYSNVMDGENAIGPTDIFVAAYNSEGVRLWTRITGNIYPDQAAGITTDHLGNIYVSGTSFGAIDGQTTNGDLDIVLVKYNSVGEKKWTRLLGSTLTEIAGSLTTDADGNVYLTGRTNGELNGEKNNGLNDIVVAKYDASGNLLWTKLAGSSSNDYDGNIITDASGVYLAGSAGGAFDGAAFAGGLTDNVLIKYDHNGTRIFTSINGSPGNEYSSGIEIVSPGKLLICGRTNGNLNGQVNNGSEDIFISNYNTNGSFISTRLIGTSSSDMSFRIAAVSGEIFICGITTAPVFFGQNSAGNYDVFLMKLSSSLSPVFVKMGGSANGDSVYDMTKPKNGIVFLAGGLSGPTTAVFHNTTFTTSFSIDGYLWKYAE